jgi:WD40 repeat protein
LIRCLSSDRIRLISGADDARIVVWDKNSGHLLVDFNDHEDKVSGLHDRSTSSLLGSGQRRVAVARCVCLGHVGFLQWSFGLGYFSR